MSFLPGWRPAIFGGVQVDIERLGSQSFPFSVPTPSSFTWSSAPFGAEASDRIIAVAFYASRSFTTLFPTPAITSMTIGGVSATIAVEVAATDSGRMAIAYAAVPTGASGNVEVTFNTAISVAQAFIYRISGAELAPFAVSSDGPSAANPVTFDLSQTVVPGAAVIGICGGLHGASSTASVSWVGLSDPLAAQVTNGENNVRISASSAYRAVRSIDGSISPTWSDNFGFELWPKQAVAAQWRA